MLGIKRFQLSLKTIMMIVLTAAAASALFAKIYQHTGIFPGWGIDAPSLFLLAIFLTAFALGNWKEHSPSQIMLQITLACLGYLVLIQISEAQFERATRYWFQGVFALTVCAPLLARRYVKSTRSQRTSKRWLEKDMRGGLLLVLEHRAPERRSPLSGGRLPPRDAVPQDPAGWLRARELPYSFLLTSTSSRLWPGRGRPERGWQRRG